jgi:hypothetical protein
MLMLDHRQKSYPGIILVNVQSLNELHSFLTSFHPIQAVCQNISFCTHIELYAGNFLLVNCVSVDSSFSLRI